MRIVFCGSGTFAVPSLQTILNSEHDLVAVVTQPPRRSGRGAKLHATPVAELAREAGLIVIETADINSDQSVSDIAKTRPDIICVVEFGQMIRLAVRELAVVDTFNLHGSLLPELRGAAPVNWAIIRGFKKTGVTSFSLVDRMDAGAMYLHTETDILPGETARKLRIRLADIGAEVVLRTISLLADGSAKAQAQDESKVTFAPILKKSDGIIRWSESAETICDLIHGVWPWPGGQTIFKRKDGHQNQVVIASAHVEDGQSTGKAGMIDSDLSVRTGSEDRRLKIIEIKPAGKRLMAWRDFVNGYRVSQGDCFIEKEIEKNV